MCRYRIIYKLLNADGTPTKIELPYGEKVDCHITAENLLRNHGETRDFINFVALEKDNERRANNFNEERVY